MKFLKIFTVLLVTTTAMSAAYAQTIHTTKVFNPTYDEVKAQLTVNVGMWDNNTCVIEKAYTEAADLAFKPHSATLLTLDSDALAAKVGNGYNCADRILQTEGDHAQTIHDAFRLYANGDEYSASSPNFFETSVN